MEKKISCIFVTVNGMHSNFIFLSTGDSEKSKTTNKGGGIRGKNKPYG
jgi:hypothetical protein